MNLLKELEKRILVLDGGWGTTLRSLGIKIDSCSEELNLSNPEAITKIHSLFAEAGADIIETNTSSATRIELSEYGLEEKLKEINEIAVELARKAIGEKGFVAASISSMGKLIEPLGEVTFDEAFNAFHEQIHSCRKADLILIETVSDLKEARIAVIAAKEAAPKLPVFCSMTFEGERTTSGTDLRSFVSVMEALDVNGIGLNCSIPPQKMLPLVEKLTQLTSLPLIVYPNAGLPKLINGNTCFPASPEEMALYAEKFYKLGGNIIGGCCGNSPSHIKAIAEKVGNKPPIKRKKINSFPSLSSRTKTIEISPKNSYIIGESINPNSKKELRAELKEKKFSLIKKLALEQTQKGADLLDVNVSMPSLLDEELLPLAVKAVEKTSSLPIVLDNTNPKALEEALKMCSGKPLINSVNASKESLEKILPPAKKYGAAVIGLTLNEKGIPSTAKERIQLAKEISAEAEKIGLRKKDLFIDFLVTTIAAEKEKAEATIESVKKANELGFNTVLGISNASTGLPNRREINFKFLCKALEAGLDLAIADVFDSRIVSLIKNKDKFDLKQDLDEFLKETVFTERKEISKELPLKEQLRQAIIAGIEEDIIPIIKNALKKIPPLEINNSLIDGLNEVGEKFKSKKLFLPNVMLSASTMKHAFTVLKKELKKSGKGKSPGKILFATVKDDVHDIGKNIVVALLESHGFKVIDLGKDVSEEKIIESAKKFHPKIICLSALMTSTMIHMQEVINALKKEGINIPVLVGGAVLNEEYAKSINAEYGEDAINAVKQAKKLFKAI